MTMALVRVNEHGRRIGETHRNACHSDADVERAIAAYEVLQSYAKVAAAMGAKKSTVRDWIKGNRRGQVGPRTSERDPLVNAHYRMPLSRRRKVLERGGAKWVNALIERALSADGCAESGGNMGAGCICAHPGAREPREVVSD